jgi:ABC-type Mn2+/Zn2+ transport system permease subunit
MLGIIVSYRYDLPTAPMIVATLAVTFFALLPISAVQRGRLRERAGEASIG